MMRLLGAALDPTKEWVCEVREKRTRRGLSANNYAWLLMDRIAKHPDIRSSKEEIYLRMIEKYGPFTYRPSFPEDIEDLKRTYRIVYNRGETWLMTKSGRWLKTYTMQCYRGSSKYNTEEMSIFIDGIVSEAQELGIETDTPDEIERLKATWNNGNQSQDTRITRSATQGRYIA